MDSYSPTSFTDAADLFGQILHFTEEEAGNALLALAREYKGAMSPFSGPAAQPSSVHRSVGVGYPAADGTATSPCNFQ